MISKHKYKNLTWIDLEKPTRDEITMLAEDYHIPELISEELLSPTIRSKVDRHENSIFMILHFPVIQKKPLIQEVDFIIGKDFLITVHYEHNGAISNFSKLFETHNNQLEKINLKNHAGSLLHLLIKELYTFTTSELEIINNYIENINHNISKENNKAMVKMISNVNRKLLDFKQAIRYHGNVIKSLNYSTAGFFPEDFDYEISSIEGEYNKVENLLEGHRDILTDLRDTNDSYLANTTNETMRILTIITFLISPVTVLSSIFMMNTDFSLIKSMQDFYIIIGAMILTSIITFIYFKTKKWL